MIGLKFIIKTSVVLIVPADTWRHCIGTVPDSKVHGANMGPTWVLSAPGRSHVGPMNLAIWGMALGYLCGHGDDQLLVPYMSDTNI